MQRVLGIAALVWSTAAAAAQVIQVVPSRASKTTEAQAYELIRATETALRELSSLDVRPALRPEVGTNCAPRATDCWRQQGRRAREGLALVVAVDRAANPQASLALVDRAAKVIGVVSAAEPAGVRAALDGLLPAELRKGQGGLSVQLASGSRLKVDGRVTSPDPTGKLFLPVGAHEVDLLLPSGKALLTMASVAEGRISPLKLDPKAWPDERRGAGPLLWAAGGLWTTGALTVLSSLIVGSVANYSHKQLIPCPIPVTPGCSSYAQSIAVNARGSQLIDASNVLVNVGGGLMLAGVASFSIDVVLGSQK